MKPFKLCCKHNFWAFTLWAVMLGGISSTYAQNPFEDAIKQLNSENVRGYVQPLINGFGANLNSGIYHTAEIPNLGFHFQLQIVGMGTIIGDAEKTYMATPPDPFTQTPVQTATIFGTTGTIVTGPANLKYQFQNGQVRASSLPLAVPQLTIGTVFGTQAIVRYVPVPEIGNSPKMTLLGAGIQHSISQYIPLLPVDVAVGGFYQRLTIGDIIDARTMNAGVLASKSFSLITLYGGAQYETATMNLNYTYTGPGSTPNTKINVDLDADNSFRFIGGLNLNLVIAHLNADINVGKVTVASGGLSFGL
jgi:hypothetical protein